jgi:D-proline reductase (dithiol) PrdB
MKHKAITTETDDGVDFAEIERTHVRRNLYPDFIWRASDAFSPLNPLRVPLDRARVAFVTTAGAHLPDQLRFDVAAKAGDPSFRTFSSAMPLTAVMLTHPGYDTQQASVDKNVVLPLDHLRALVADGRIGALGPTIYSTMGYVADTALLVEETAPAIARRLVEDQTDLVLLAPT